MKFFPFLGLFILASACQDDRLKNDASQSLIDGAWRSDCVADGEFYRLSSFDFSFAQHAERRDDFFADGDCSKAVYSNVYLGTYELSVTWVDYTHNLIFWVESSSLAVRDPEIAAAQACGLETWDLGVLVEANRLSPQSSELARAIHLRSLASV